MRSDPLTDPEHRVDRGMRKRIVAEITRRGGCACCVHRVDAWGKSTCPQASRTWPLCMHTPGMAFELDERTLEKAA